MFGIQVQPVTALHRDLVLRGPTSIFVARDDAVLAPHGQAAYWGRNRAREPPIQVLSPWNPRQNCLRTPGRTPRANRS
jgi:hypothetical protein